MITINNDINELKRVRELIINIDMINGFVKEGTLAAPSIQRILPVQRKMIDEVFHGDVKTGVIFIRDSHTKNAAEFKTFPEHCLEGSYESELVDELKEYEKYSLTYLKNSTNLMFAPGLQHDLLKFTNLERVRLMGCLSEVCVLNGAIGLKTFFDQINKDVEVCVHPDAIDTFDAPGHDADEITRIALENMKSNGIKVLGKRL